MRKFKINHGCGNMILTGTYFNPKTESYDDLYIHVSDEDIAARIANLGKAVSAVMQALNSTCEVEVSEDTLFISTVLSYRELKELMEMRVYGHLFEEQYTITKGAA